MIYFVGIPGIKCYKHKPAFSSAPLEFPLASFHHRNGLPSCASTYTLGGAVVLCAFEIMYLPMQSYLENGDCNDLLQDLDASPINPFNLGLIYL